MATYEEKEAARELQKSTGVRYSTALDTILRNAELSEGLALLTDSDFGKIEDMKPKMVKLLRAWVPIALNMAKIDGHKWTITPSIEGADTYSWQNSENIILSSNYGNYAMFSFAAEDIENDTYDTRYELGITATPEDAAYLELYLIDEGGVSYEFKYDKLTFVNSINNAISEYMS